MPTTNPANAVPMGRAGEGCGKHGEGVAAKIWGRGPAALACDRL